MMELPLMDPQRALGQIGLNFGFNIGLAAA